MPALFCGNTLKVHENQKAFILIIGSSVPLLLLLLILFQLLDYPLLNYLVS